MAYAPINYKDRYAIGWSDPRGSFGGGNVGVGMPFTPASQTYRVDEQVYKMERYAELCGDKVEIVELEAGQDCDDVKVILLKASEPEQFIKDVGIKISETKFAVYREEGETLWSK